MFVEFDSTRFDSISERFHGLRDDEWPREKNRCLIEVSIRLRHCAICIRRIQALQQRFKRLWEHPKARMRHRSSRPDGEVGVTAEIWVMTEAFYHLAWRVRELIDAKHGLDWAMPDGSIGRVRNLLIVHPEKQKGVTALSFSHGEKDGPQLKFFGDGNRPRTKGLYVHASEFAAALELSTLTATYKQCINNSTMSPKEFTAFRIDERLLAAMREIKEAEGLSVTTQVELAVREWLKKRGHVVKLATPAQRREYRKFAGR